MSITLKIKKPEAAPAAEAPAAPAPEAANVNPKQEGIFVSSRYANPLAGKNGNVKPEKWTWAAVLSIITVVLFGILVVLQYMDYSVLTYT